MSTAIHTNIPNDDESGQRNINHFVGHSNIWINEKELRNRFVSRVYTILCIQLTFTSLMLSIVMSSTRFKNVLKGRDVIAYFYISLAISFIILIYLICNKAARRSHPQNVILLSLFTLSYSLVVTFISCQYQTVSVSFAFGATALITFIITIWSKTTNFDITKYVHIICYISIVYIILSTFGIIIIAIFNPSLLGSQKLDIALGLFGGLLGCIYLVYDTQMILGGRQLELSEEEHVFAAISLYLDILQIFLNILRLMHR